MSQDVDFLRPLVKTVMQEVLEAEMEEAVGAGKGERTGSRLGFRSGYYSRNLVTRAGKMELRVPQDRQGRFSTAIFERCQRSEKALVSALCGDVCAGSIHPKGEGDQRGTVRARVQREHAVSLSVRGWHLP